MSERIPCPTCGTENDPDAPECRICGYRLDLAARDSGKCARCGSGLGQGFEFCQICGLSVHSRRARPLTQSLRLIQKPRGDAPAPELLQAAVATALTPPAATGLPHGFSPPAPQPVPLAVQAAISGSIPERPIAASLPPTSRPVTPIPAVVASAAAPAAPAAPPAVAAVDAGLWAPPQATSAPGPRSAGGPAPAQRRAPGASRLRLVLVQRDGSEGEVIPLGDAPLTIGRWQGDLRFPNDEFLGPAHARVDPLPGGVRVVDLGTRNGVFVRITRPEAVFPGDRFLLGHHLLRLENVPPASREPELGADGVRGFGTPLQAAWARLVLLGPGGAEAETHYLRHPQVLFGRELGDIVFPSDPFVSWQHAQLSMELAEGVMGVTLTDLRSANGTYLRAREDVMLQPGDMFRVGDQIFRVRMH